jgi:hypothetical protein
MVACRGLWINKGKAKELIKINILLDSKCLLKQPAMGKGQKDAGLSLWKRLILIAGILLPGGSLVVLVPSQVVYAQNGGSGAPFICRAGWGGNGGYADNRSSGANGGTGGDCVNGPRGGDGAPGGLNSSPGGQGGNVFF